MTAATSSRPAFFLYGIWALLAVRMVIAAVRHESLRDDLLALPLIAFVVLSAVAGGRIYAQLGHRTS